MKVVLDENLSPALARALNALFAGEHDVRHLRDMFGPSVKDEEWIAKLSGEGRWVVISGDSRIAKRKSEQLAFRRSRPVGFFFAPALNAAKVTKQMQRLLAMWDAIDGISGRIAGGAMYELPMSGLIRQLKG